MDKIEKLEAMKRKWTNEEPHHFMDKAALRERKSLMRKMRRAEILENLKEYVKVIFKNIFKDENRGRVKEEV